MRVTAAAMLYLLSKELLKFRQDVWDRCQLNPDLTDEILDNAVSDVYDYVETSDLIEPPVYIRFKDCYQFLLYHSEYLPVVRDLPIKPIQVT